MPLRCNATVANDPTTRTSDCEDVETYAAERKYPDNGLNDAFQSSRDARRQRWIVRSAQEQQVVEKTGEDNDEAKRDDKSGICQRKVRYRRAQLAGDKGEQKQHRESVEAI